MVGLDETARGCGKHDHGAGHPAPIRSRLPDLKKPARSTTLEWPDAKAVRDKLGLSQGQFAALMGISPRTLQNWEQGHRRPEGTARALLRAAEAHPQAVLEALHR